MGGKVEKYDIHKEDYVILSTLLKDSTLSLIEIAKATSLAINTVKKRINEYVKKEIISGYTVTLNMIKLGFTHYKVLLEFKEKNEVECEDCGKIFNALDILIRIARQRGSI